MRLSTNFVRGVCGLLLVASATAVAQESAWTDDDIRAEVQAALNFAAIARLAVSEKYISTGKWPESNDAAGVTVLPTRFTSAMSVGKAGIITITFDSSTAIAGKSIVLTPSAEADGAIRWACRSPDIDGQHLPEQCR